MLKRLLILALAAALMPACSNHFELFTEKEDIPVVYGLLSKSEDTQFVRLERAFLDKDQSARVIAGEPDSVFYSDAVVELVHLPTGDRFEMERINAADIGLPRDEGDFPTDPNYIYTLDSEVINLTGGDTYGIEVRREGGDNIAYSEALVIGDLRILTPSDPTIQRLNYQGSSSQRIRWREANEVEFFNVRLRFNYEERSPATGGEWVQDDLFWVVSNRVRANTVTFAGDEFLQFIGNALVEDPTIDRRFRSIDIRLDAVGSELAAYIDVGLANLGITSSNEIPLYTNVDGGLGVFSSTNFTEVQGFNLTSTAIDSLLDGRFTEQLNFIR